MTLATSALFGLLLGSFITLITCIAGKGSFKDRVVATGGALLPMSVLFALTSSSTDVIISLAGIDRPYLVLSVILIAIFGITFAIVQLPPIAAARRRIQAAERQARDAMDGRVMRRMGKGWFG